MKTRYTLIGLAALSVVPAVFGATPTVRLERDVPVTLRLKQELSSETAHVNDRVEFEVLADVSAAGTVVIPKGSAAWGRVAEAAPVGRLMRSGRLAVDIESVTLSDGGNVRLRASCATHPEAKKPRDATSDSLGALPALPFTMFQYGKAIRIPAGKLVTVYTAAPVTLGSASVLAPSASSGDVLPARNATPRNAVAVDRAVPPAAPRDVPASLPTPVNADVLPPTHAASRNAGATERVAPAPPSAGSETTATVTRTLPPPREPVSVSRGSSKKLLTILAVGAAAGLAGVLSAKGHGGAQTAATVGATPPTTVGIGTITVGGPH